MRTPITPVLRLILVGALFVGACGGTATQSKPAAAPTTSTTAAPTAPAPTTAPQRQALGTIDPCVVGAWKGQEFTLPGPIPDLDASGGANARMLIRATVARRGTSTAWIRSPAPTIRST